MLDDMIEIGKYYACTGDTSGDHYILRLDYRAIGGYYPFAGLGYVPADKNLQKCCFHRCEIIREANDYEKKLFLLASIA